ncbi:hypothetical protein PPN31119_04538 [Pandoraea pnomenusa]|uniref:Phage gp6-like head-tail connector protein n=1 Tax=Pandoraea pnomenusa TaxID=93220 RepID=A0ABY6WQ97_9BURK|nr:head-tail connector protein [Pandoraea pnomenusa]VVE73233.1 hypothetical protein PPN31119_04538 [Pandoraea pnomenusa]
MPNKIFFPSTVGAGRPVTIEPPEAEPLNLDEAKAHLRVDDDDENELIEGAIVAARELLEHELNRPLLAQTCRVAIDEFPSGRILLWNDVTALVEVGYVDADGQQQALDLSSVRLLQRSYVVPRKSWPRGEQVTIKFKCGAFDEVAGVPDSCKAWMKLVLGTLYEQREIATADQTFALPGRFAAGLIDRYRAVTL